MFPTLVIPDNYRPYIVRNAVIDYFSGSFVEKVSNFIVSLSMKLQDAFSQFGVIANLAERFVFG